MIRRQPVLLHPRLTVVPVDGGARPAIAAAPGRTVVGHAQLAEAMEAVAERRRARLRERIAGLEAELRDAEGRLAEADATVTQRRADRDSFFDAAQWCEALPVAASETATSIAVAEAELAERLRIARDAGRALDRVLDQRASADAAIDEARRQLAALRAGAADDPDRERAAAQLAAQAASVEARLTEAEGEARTRAEQAKREVSELERELERLAREQRDRHVRLVALVDCLPGEARPPHGDDPVDHVRSIAAGLRGLAGIVDAELAGLQAEVDRQRAGCETQRRRVQAILASLDRIAPEDAAEALADLVTGAADGVVVLDDVVAASADGQDGLLRALEVTEPTAPLVVLSSDPTVLGWAIDLPADRGGLAGPAAVEALIEPNCTDRALARRHALASSTGDQP